MKLKDKYAKFMMNLIRADRNLEINKEVERHAADRFYKDIVAPTITMILLSIITLLLHKLDIPVDRYIINFITYLSNSFNIWGTVCFVLFLPFLLFLFRQKLRLSYGLIEFWFGFICVILPIFENNFDYSSIDLNHSLIIRLIAGLYILVRALDNICKGLKEKKRFPKFTNLLKYN